MILKSIFHTKEKLKIFNKQKRADKINVCSFLLENIFAKQKFYRLPLIPFFICNRVVFILLFLL